MLVVLFLLVAFQGFVVETRGESGIGREVLEKLHLTGMTLDGLYLWGWVGGTGMILAGTVWAILKRRVWCIVAANALLREGCSFTRTAGLCRQ
jgi:hypothetical protein